MTVAAHQITPTSLRLLQHPPVFLYREARPREERELLHQARRQRIEHHSVDAIRDEALRGLKQLWPAEAYRENVPRLRRLWIKTDAGRRLPKSDTQALEDLGSRLVREWPRFREKLADNQKFLLEVPRVAASMMLIGWAGIDVPYSREAGLVPLETLDHLEEALAELERGLGVEPGPAWAEVSAMGLTLIQQPPQPQNMGGGA